MKTLLSILIVLCSFGVNAQQTIEVRNNTNMDLDFVFYIYDGCSQFDTYVVPIAAGQPHITPTLPANQEYVWVEITPTSCAGSGLNVATPTFCNSTCTTPGPPPAMTVFSCSGFYTYVHARWVDCGAPGFGYLGIDEYN
jgi:hypothetical protein